MKCIEGIESVNQKLQHVVSSKRLPKPCKRIPFGKLHALRYEYLRNETRTRRDSAPFSFGTISLLAKQYLFWFHYLKDSTAFQLSPLPQPPLL
jgi:hypothetical protein